MPRFIHQSHGLLALGRGLICPAPRGGVAGLAGAGQCLGTGRGAGPAAGPAAPSLTRWAAAGRAPSVAAGRRPAARPSPAPCLTARAPRLVSGSAIFTHYRSRCRAKATGRRGHRPLPPPPAAGSCGAGPPSSQPDSWGACTAGGETFKVDTFCCMPLASRCGWSRKLRLSQTPPSISRGVQSWPTVQGTLCCYQAPRWAQGDTRPWNCMQKNV